jgi:putative membrane protein
MVTWYNAVQALHVLAVVAWMAAMLYLPRLFVYHSQAERGGEAERFFIVMERRLLKGIMTPAMLATFAFAVALLVMQPSWLNDGWLHVKLLAVLGLAGLHGYYAAARKKFERGERPRSERHWRLMNEAPFVLLVVIVFMVLLKPWLR